jgi:hypothetical protein
MIKEMKHIQTFENFLNEANVSTVMDAIKSGMGWASVDYVRNAPLNRPGKIALAQMLAADGILFDDDSLSDEHHKGNANPVEDGIAPLSIEDAKKLF